MERTRGEPAPGSVAARNARFSLADRGPMGGEVSFEHPNPAAPPARAYAAPRPLRVLIADDAVVSRRWIANVVGGASDLELVAVVGDGIAALEAIDELAPDVVLLDLVMPRLDGLGVLAALAPRRRRPHVIVCSRFAASGTETARAALAAGAEDVIDKPGGEDGTSGATFGHTLLRKIRRFSQASARPEPDAGSPAATAPPRLRPPTVITTRPAKNAWTETVASMDVARAIVQATRGRAVPADPGAASPPARGLARSRAELAPAARSARPYPVTALTPRPTRGAPDTARPTPAPGAPSALPAGGSAAYDLVAIGVSTGGPQALLSLLPGLPAEFPAPVVVVLHIAAPFTSELARLLAPKCQLPVRVAERGAPLAGGVTLAVGGSHLVLQHARLGSDEAPVVVTEVDEGAPESKHRPAVDVFFRSAAAVVGRRTLAVVLTGMGQDGLAGAHALRAAGGTILVQDEATSVVRGVAGAVSRAGLADAVLPLEDIAAAIVSRVLPTSARGAASPR